MVCCCEPCRGTPIGEQSVGWGAFFDPRPIGCLQPARRLVAVPELSSRIAACSLVGLRYGGAAAVTAIFGTESTWE